MKRNRLRVVSGAAALLITGGVLAATVGTAAAATTTPWEPDASNEVGTLSLFNAAGTQITSGTNLAHLFDFAEGSTVDAQNGTKAYVQFAQPIAGTDPQNPSSGTANPGTWPTSNPSGTVGFPVTTPASLAGSPDPVATVATTDAGGNLQSFINQSNQPATTSPLYGIWQVRLYTTGGGQGTANANPSQYWAADVLVSGTSWTQIYPTPPKTVAGTTTTLTASPSPTDTATPVTLTATETETGVTPAASAPGSVDFKDTTTGTDLGTKAVNGSGVATVTNTFGTVSASDTLTATFTPTDPTSFGSSTGTTTIKITAPEPKSTTTVTVQQDGTAGDDVKLSATVAPSTAVGTVSFFDGTSTTPLNSTPVSVSSTPGVYNLDIPAGLAAGQHTISAVFTPTDPTVIEGSSGAAPVFTLSPPAGSPCAAITGNATPCTDPQTIEGTIPAGTLVINTPYTATNPLNLGTLALNGAGTEYSAAATFKSIVVTDNRSGGLGWTVSALAGNLSDGKSNAGSQISGENVGLTNLSAAASAGYTATFAASDNPAADPAVAPGDAGHLGLGGTTAHTVATSTVPAGKNGDGTVTINGLLTLNAPTSTEAGLFTGTITFTVG